MVVGGGLEDVGPLTCFVVEEFCRVDDALAHEIVNVLLLEVRLHWESSDDDLCLHVFAWYGEDDSLDECVCWPLA